MQIFLMDIYIIHVIVINTIVFNFYIFLNEISIYILNIAIYVACKKGHLDIVKLLLHHEEIDVNIICIFKILVFH